MSDRALDPRHRLELEGSSIPEAAIVARGYWTATKKNDLKELGFSEGQQLVPALVLPLWSPSGDLAGYQMKPDHPRVNGNGKPSKYEFPRHSKMILDVPPGSRPLLADPRIPLLITEGVKKADSASGRGLCCVALLGVWNWRGTNQDGGKVALPEWEQIALNERDIYVVFDSDVMVNPQVHEALARLGAFLTHRKARVKYVYLPHGENGAKVGLDDFLGAGHTTQDVFDLATSTLRDSKEPVAPARFVVENGCIKQSRLTEDGVVLTQLSNFTAVVKEELILDDGVTTSRAYTIDGAHESGRAFPTVRVPASRFSSMSWTSEWGMAANIRCGMSSKDAVREAIQTFSEAATERVIYTHTGWRKLDEKWAFLMPNAAIGLDRAVEVEIAQRYRLRYALPHTPEQVKEAIRLSLATLDVVPDLVSIPIWAAMFRAVLSSILQHNLTVWIVGQTGSMKSTYTALQMSHFGGFQYDSLPEGWSSTANALEKGAHELRDLPLVIDDYAPGPLDRRELEGKAGRLLREQGNSNGRSRLRADLSEAPTYYPRGLIVSTGESVPTGQSANARSLRVEMKLEDVSLPRLNIAQASAARLPHAMSGFIHWLIPQMATLPEDLTRRYGELRRETGAEIRNAHARVIANVAHLRLGADLAVSFAEDHGAVSATEAEELLDRANVSLIEAGRKMTSDLAEERPSTRFLRLFASLVLQGQVWVKQKDTPTGANDPENRLVGWHDDRFIYLNPEASFQAVARHAQMSGEPFPVSQASLRDALVKDGIATPQPTRGGDSCEAGLLTVRVKIDGVRRRVMQMDGVVVAKILGDAILGFEPPEEPIPAFPAFLEEAPHV